MKIQKLTKLIAIWSFGATIILLLNLFFHYSESLFMPLFSAIIFYLIYKELTSHKTIKDFPQTLIKITPAILLLSFVLFYIGIGMHGAANHIAYYFGEGVSLAKEYAYFYDEILGHVTMYLGLFGLMLGGSLIQARRPFTLQLDFKNISVLLFAAMFHGIGLATAMIEGHTSIFGLIAAIIFIPLVSLHHINKQRKLKIIVREYPFDFFIVLVMISTVFILIAYFLIYKGFPEISTQFNFWKYMFI
ncbi:MAG: hypothetical protein JSW73_04135 [Candidatus Woesearchaeota archaeon]|nr:MAG: hypothetical protein JSW73_04135 [Candidatus Woesearchaeota archaeon]